MDYILITVLQFIGVGFQALFKVIELDKKFPDDSMWQVTVEFWKSDKFTLILSGLIVFANLIIHFIITEYSSLDENENFHLYSFGVALVLGYGGQKIVYYYLGKAEKVLTRKADKLDNL